MGIGFWVLQGLLIFGLSVIVIYRLIRLISVKSFLDSHKILMADFKSSAKKLQGRLQNSRMDNDEEDEIELFARGKRKEDEDDD